MTYGLISASIEVNRHRRPEGRFKKQKNRLIYKHMDIVQKTQTFFKEVYVELRKVNWLTRGEVLRYTLIVLAVTIVVSAFLGGLDYIFSELIKRFIIK